MNDSTEENGLVPSLVVLGIIPGFPIPNSDLPIQKERVEAIKSTRTEMNSIVAERHVQEALTKNSACCRLYIQTRRGISGQQ